MGFAVMLIVVVLGAAPAARCTRLEGGELFDDRVEAVQLMCHARSEDALGRVFGEGCREVVEILGWRGVEVAEPTRDEAEPCVLRLVGEKGREVGGDVSLGRRESCQLLGELGDEACDVAILRHAVGGFLLLHLAVKDEKENYD